VWSVTRDKELRSNKVGNKEKIRKKWIRGVEEDNIKKQGNRNT
jgi:hypothetical protein